MTSMVLRGADPVALPLPVKTAHSAAGVHVSIYCGGAVAQIQVSAMLGQCA